MAVRDRLGLGDRSLATEHGIEAAYAAHGPELFRFASRSLGDTQLAEEAVQETFVRAWRNAQRFDEDLGSLRTWLFAIVRNVVIDLARARAVRPRAAGGDSIEVAVVESDIDRLAVVWQVEEALLRIRPEHRTALVEVHTRDRPYDDVAAELGVPVGTIKSRVYYGLRALRLALEELGWEQP
ncbi:MAG: sigma-70 family RNA polymerase sigma factor [Acidimicrobiia bacterium]|nr:sigma-70 family RNA polymerase sigma factor [Acidimicrobiia bacterium]